MSLELGPTTCLRVSSNVYARAFGDEIVLLDFARGEYFALDAIGAFVWRRLEQGEALGAIAEALSSDYDVSEEQALADVVALAGELRAQSLVDPAAA